MEPCAFLLPQELSEDACTWSFHCTAMVPIESPIIIRLSGLRDSQPNEDTGTRDEIRRNMRPTPSKWWSLSQVLSNDLVGGRRAAR